MYKMTTDAEMGKKKKKKSIIQQVKNVDERGTMGEIKILVLVIRGDDVLFLCGGAGRGLCKKKSQNVPVC